MTVLVYDSWRAGEATETLVPDVADVVDGLATAAAGDVLVISGGGTGRAVRVAREAIRRPGVAHVDVPGSPSRRYLLAYALRHLPPEGYGYAEAVIAAMSEVCATRVLLSSVAGLERPAPGLGHHVASWLPGSSFAVDLDDGRIKRLRTAALALPAGPFGVIAERWPEGHQVAVDPLPSALVTLRGPHDAAPWRAKRWLEVTVSTRAVVDVVQWALGGSSPAACPSCTRAVVGVRCPFCGIPVPDRQPSAPPVHVGPLEKELSR